MKISTPVCLLVLCALGLAARLWRACGGGGNSSGRRARPARRSAAGSIVVGRHGRSPESMDKENVFDNESIWILEQIMEPLYTVAPDGKGVDAVAGEVATPSRRTRRPTRSTCGPG